MSIPPKDPIIYAELLLNIRQITIAVTLHTLSDANTSLTISPDGQTFTVSHQGRISSIQLPRRVSLGSTGTTTVLPLPTQPTQEISLRIPLPHNSDAAKQRQQNAQSNSNGASSEDASVPWSIPQLASSTTINCKACVKSLIGVGRRVKDWRRLPGQDWEELMELWHCHKPVAEAGDATTEDDSTASKGYGAMNKLVALEGVGFVDAWSLLLHAEDCEGIMAQSIPNRNASFRRKSRARKEKDLLCRNCDMIIGVEDERYQGWRVYPWAIRLSYLSSPSTAQTTTAFEPFPLELCLSSIILTELSTGTATKFRWARRDSIGHEEQDVQTWVLNPDLYFSSSLPNSSLSQLIPNETTNNVTNNPTRAIKVFYQMLPPSSRPATTTTTKHESERIQSSVEKWRSPNGSLQSLDESKQQEEDRDTQDYDKDEDDDDQEDDNAEMQRIDLPSYAIDELLLALRHSTTLLPASARKMGGWDVGLLRRFES